MSTKKSMVASGHPLVSQAALEMLDAGGNAFDAVVAAGFMAAVAEPGLTSLGGGGFLMAHTVVDGQTVLFDFFSDTPGRGRIKDDLVPHFFPVTVHFSGIDQDFNVGLGSVAVPGNLKGFLHVHRKLGVLPLVKVISPAGQAAESGVLLNQQQAHFLRLLQPIMTLSEVGRALYSPNGRYVTEGDIVHYPDLADFLGDLSAEGGDSLYKGPLAEIVGTDMEKGNGILTVQDLAAYQVIERSPLQIPYRDSIFYTNPPPSFGGTLICAALQSLDRQDLSAILWGSSAHLERLADLVVEMEKMRQEGVETLRQSSGNGTESADSLRLNGRGTTHVSIIDCQGNAASMTTSNGEGSGYFVPGTGIMLNNMMGEDDLHPEGFHASRPGVRVASMMSPSILRRDGKIVMVVGSGGSKRIRTAITQVVSHIVDFGLKTRDAVEAPRLHWDGKTLQMEPGFAQEAIDVLKNQMPVQVWQRRDVYFGGVHTVSSEAGSAGDPRRGGDAREGSCR